MIQSETDPSAPAPAPVKHQGVDRGEWGRVRIPGAQQGRPHTHPRSAESHPDSTDAGELDAFDDFDAYDQTTSG